MVRRGGDGEILKNAVGCEALFNSARMKAVVLGKNKVLTYREYPAPDRSDAGYFLIRVRAVGLCSSDIPRAFESKAYAYPLILGHEIMGEIVGKKTKQPVAVYPLISCGACASCRSGAENLCAHYNYLGSRAHGGFAEYVQAPRKNIFPLPPGMDPVVAAIIEPTAVLFHALHRAAAQKSDRILIIGDGSMGLLMSRILVAGGFHSVALVGKYAYKLAIAEAFGAVPMDANDTACGVPPDVYDIVFELAGTRSAYEQAIQALRPRGRLILIGNIRGDLALSGKTFSQILRKELVATGSWNSLALDWKRAIRFLAAEPEARKVVSHVYPLARAPTVLPRIFNRSLKRYIKAVFLV